MISTYPRVTHILQETKSEQDKQKLLEWQRKNTLRGEIARNNGTNFHSAIYNYLNSGIIPTFECEQEANRWKIACPELEIVKHSYLSLESEVRSDKYQYAGRLDCLAWENDDLILIDWKTSSWLKKKAYIEDYFIQGAAYSLAAYECGVATKMPLAIKIYVFTPSKAQILSRILEFELVTKWLERLELFKNKLN